MYQPILSLHTWVSLPNETRRKIRSLFNIPCTGNVIVSDGKIETDGTTTEDFRSLTVEKMQAYLKSDSTDFIKLFDMVVSNISNPVIEIPTVQSIPEEPVITPKKKGRPSSK